MTREQYDQYRAFLDEAATAASFTTLEAVEAKVEAIGLTEFDRELILRMRTLEKAYILRG